MMTDKGLSIRLFGRVSLSLDGKPLTDLPTRKAEALLIYLVCHERPFSREQLADLLWDDRAQEQGLANLRSILSSLRRLLKPYLLITRQTVAFNHDSDYWLDTAAFAEAVGAWRLEAGEFLGSSLESLEKAVSLYAGDFLAGFYLRESRGFEEWAMLERERWQRQTILVIHALAAHHLRQGQFYLAARMARRLLQLDDLSETACRMLMLALARNGELSAALAQYQEYRRRLVEELGVLPSPETDALTDRIRRASHSFRHNFPSAPTPFVGRERELTDLKQQLTDPACRLLTVIGPGGVGKTRLALEAASRLIPTGYFLNGLRFVLLTNVTTAALVPGLIAAELNLTLQGESPPGEQVAAALSGQEMLLLLDNVEHLLEGNEGEELSRFLARLLTAAPSVTLLVTSQRRLYLQEEWLFDVGGLETPATDDAARAEQYSAVQLFLQTAVRIQRQFRPTPDDMAAIITICRTLEGLPLGIELAAAWLRHLPCAAIAQTLHERIDLLTTPLRNVPERHRSITAVFDYSWALLTAAGQTIFARLALFQGGFTLAAAVAVAGASLVDLARLEEYSLLRQENGRFTIHELLRQYAARQLALSGAETAIHQAHARFFLEYLAAQGSGEETAQRQAIRAELPNIRAAWQWAAVHDETALLKAAVTLHNFYSAASWFYEGIAAFEYALEQLARAAAAGATAEQAQARADLLSRKARMHIHIGQLPAARQALDAAMDALQPVDDPLRLSTIMGYVAITTFYAGEFVRAAEWAQESLALAERSGDQDGMAFALNFLGSCYKSLGDYAAAADYFTRSVAVYEQMGDDLGKAMTINNLGNLAQAQGDYAAAQRYYLTCSRLFQAHDHLHGAATTLANAGQLAHKLGDLAQATALLEESLQLKRAQQDERGTAVALIGLADVALAAGDGAAARAYLQEGIALAQQAGDVKLTLEGVALWGALLHQGGADPARAARLLAFVWQHPALTQEVRTQVEPLRGEMDDGVWATAVAWAEGQTLAGVTAVLAATGS